MPPVSDETPERLFHAIVLMGAALTAGSTGCSSDDSGDTADVGSEYYSDIYVMKQDISVADHAHADISTDAPVDRTYADIYAEGPADNTYPAIYPDRRAQLGDVYSADVNFVDASDADLTNDDGDSPIDVSFQDTNVDASSVESGE